jgi:hypothetical protein
LYLKIQNIASQSIFWERKPLANFAHILRAEFLPIFFCQKNKTQTLIMEKLYLTL